MEELTRAAAGSTRAARMRHRDAAERELGKLGSRIHRRTRRGSTDGTGVEALTERELQVARLIVDRRTNAQIAAELFLSPKTVETHVRHLFQKLDVSSRVEVARVVERRRARRPPPNQGAGSGCRPDVGAPPAGILVGSTTRLKRHPMATHLYRLGGWAFHNRRKVVVGWLLVLGRVIASASAFSGKSSNKFEVPGTESQEAQDLLDEKYPGAGGASARVVFAAPEGEKLTDPENKAAVMESRRAGAQGAGRHAGQRPVLRPRRSRRTAASATPT